jgi:hypothetical protein
MSLTEKAMIAKLSFSIIGQRKKDQIATNKSNQALGTSDAAGLYQKIKISRENIIDAIRIRDSALKYHRKMTTPFTADNWNLIGSEKILEYSKEIADYKTKFKLAVDDIQNRWPAIVAFEEKRLDPIFIADEYPSQNEVSNFFSFYHKLKPIVDPSHVVIKLEAEVLEEIKEELRKEAVENTRRSLKDMWNRLFDPVANMADICSNDKKIFGSLIENVKEIVDILPDLNIINDTDLNNMAREVKFKLLSHTAGQLRDDKDLKRRIGAEAQAVADKMEGYMGFSS